jgi:hypothetical protein
MKVKTTPENVREANEALFRATMNLPQAAVHCGMTQKEMKMTFREYLKYHPPIQDSEQTGTKQPKVLKDLAIIDETEGGF